jgi:hypothetical protein
MLAEPITLTAAALVALKKALSKAVIFAASQDAKWYQGLFSRLSTTQQSLYPGTVNEVYATYGLPGMTAAKAERILLTAPYEIKRAQDKAAAGEDPAVMARYARAFGQVLDEAKTWTEQNVPAAAPAKSFLRNPIFLIGAAGAALLILPKLFPNINHGSTKRKRIYF